MSAFSEARQSLVRFRQAHLGIAKSHIMDQGHIGSRVESHLKVSQNQIITTVQGSTNRQSPGCVNAAGKLRQKW